MRSDQGMEPGHPLHAFGESCPFQTGSVFVFDEHVVMGLSPVMTHKHPAHRTLLVLSVRAEATSSFLMVQCSKHVIPPAVQVDLTDQQAHDLDLGLQGVRSETVLTCQRLGTSLPH